MRICGPGDRDLPRRDRQQGRLRLVEETIQVNEERKYAMGHRVIDANGGDVRGKTIAVLGLTFKPNTDDMRDSPSIALISVLQQAGARVRVYDPQGMGHAAEFLMGVTYARDSYECVADADCTVLVTEWAEFRQLDLARVAASMVSPVFVDLRNAIGADALAKAGFIASGIGYPISAGEAEPGVRPDAARSRKAKPRPVAGETEANRLLHPDHATIQ